jgi:hypothetical protein
VVIPTALALLLAASAPAAASPPPEASVADYENLCPGISAEAASTRPPLSWGDVENAAAAVRAKHFPELAGYDVRLEPFRSESDYLRAAPELGTAWKDAPDRTYLLRINPALLSDPPSARALRAILTHEFGHIRDYARMSGAQLAGFAVNYELGSIAAYERATDAAALEKGEGCGLIAYRLWLYARVSGETLARKKRDYATPSEIAERLRSRAAGKP